MPNIATVSFDKVRDLCHEVCRVLAGNDIAECQAAVVLAYIEVAGALTDIPKEHVPDYATAMISQGLSALPPVINAVREMTPEDLKLATMPIQGTS